jgi:hypothetical protein
MRFGTTDFPKIESVLLSWECTQGVAPYSLPEAPIGRTDCEVQIQWWSKSHATFSTNWGGSKVDVQSGTLVDDASMLRYLGCSIGLRSSRSATRTSTTGVSMDF